VASGKASWFEFAKEVVGDYEVEPVSTDEFVTAAKRPTFSVLDNSSELVEPIGDWRERWQLAKTEVLGKL
jgi:dTDP-4-dehydrorhamnose reductase